MQHNQTVRRRLQNGKGYLYLAPSLIILLVFTIYPLIKAFMMSFCEDYSIINGSFKGVNLQNYQDLFADDVFLKALSNTSIYVVFVVPVSILLSLVIAVLIHNGRPGQGPSSRPCTSCPTSPASSPSASCGAGSSTATTAC